RITLLAPRLRLLRGGGRGLVGRLATRRVAIPLGRLLGRLLLPRARRWHVGVVSRLLTPRLTVPVTERVRLTGRIGIPTWARHEVSLKDGVPENGALRQGASRQPSSKNP